jgi:tartrate-resistant acid phosphatase type 5
MVFSHKVNAGRPKTLAALLAVIFLLAPSAPRVPAQSAGAAARPAQKLSSELLNKLPEDLRDAARAHLMLMPDEQQRWLGRDANQLRTEALSALAQVPAAADFVLRLLPREPSAPNRISLLRAIPRFQHWRPNARVRGALSDLILSDPEPAVVAQALDTLRGLEAQTLRALLERRLQAAREGGDAKLLSALAPEHERWIVLERGAALPSFMRAAPPAFTLKPAGRRVRVLAFGDFGTGSEAQKRVAGAMLREHRERPFDFGLTTGDNFYPRGMESPADSRWQTQWEDLYTPLGIRFYASLGNHDWINQDSVAAELLYAGRSESWRLPAPYYTFSAGPVQFFAVDTDEISAAQAAWLGQELEKSRAAWKVVYGHHPAFVSNVWGPGYTDEMRRALWPLIRGRADVYLSGHHHSLQHLRSPEGEGGTHFITSGGGGAGTYPLAESDPLLLFGRSAHGYTTLEADERELTFRHVGEDGRELYSYTLRK